MALSSVGNGSLMGAEGTDMPLSTTEKPTFPWPLNSTQSPQMEQVSVSPWPVSHSFMCHTVFQEICWPACISHKHFKFEHNLDKKQIHFCLSKVLQMFQFHSLFCRCLFLRWRRSSAWSSHIRTFVTLRNRYAANAKGMFFLFCFFPPHFIHKFLYILSCSQSFIYYKYI